jgi:hypothetical protein
MTLVRYALERFRRIYYEHAQPGASSAPLLPGALVDYVVRHVLLDGAGDEYELINWYEMRGAELRRAAGLQGPPLPNECTCITDPCCSVHGVPRAL